MSSSDSGSATCGSTCNALQGGAGPRLVVPAALVIHDVENLQVKALAELVSVAGVPRSTGVCVQEGCGRGCGAAFAVRCISG